MSDRTQERLQQLEAMKSREAQLAALAKLAEGDPHPTYELLACRIPLTDAFRNRLASMLMPEEWAPRDDTDEEPTHRLVAKRLPGRPSISSPRRREVFWLVMGRGGPTKMGLHKAAKELGMEAASVRKIFYAVRPEIYEEYDRAYEDKEAVQSMALPEDEAEAMLLAWKDERRVENYRRKKARADKSSG